MTYEILKSCLCDLKLNRVVEKKGNEYVFECNSDVLIPAEQIKSIEAKIAKELGIKANCVSLIIKYCSNIVFENVICEYFEEITKLLSYHSPIAKSFCKYTEVELSANHLKVKLAGVSAFVCKFRFSEYYVKKIREMFDRTVHILFIDGDSELLFNNYLNQSARETEKILAIHDEVKRQHEAFSFENTNVVKEEIDEEPDDNPIIFGKPIKGTVVKMDEVNLDTGRVVIIGKVLTVDFRTLKSGTILVTFIVTDNTFSHTCKVFAKDRQAKRIKDKLKPNLFIRVEGMLEYDQYVRESIFKAANIIIDIESFKVDESVDKRVELHLHSKMSTMDGVTNIDEYIRRAAAWGHKALAITDHGVVQAFPKAYETANKLNKGKAPEDKFKIIYGVEAYLKNEGGRGKRRNFHFIILVKSEKGIKNLYKLISKSHLEEFNRFPRMTKAMLTEYREGLIFGTACEAGELYDALVNGAPDDELEQIAQFYDYLEIQPLGNNEFMTRGDSAITIQNLKENNKRIYNIAKKLEKPCVATGDVHFMDPHEEYYRRILMFSKGFSDADMQAPLYFRTTNEMINEFNYFTEAEARDLVIDAPNKIAEMVDFVKPIPDGTFTPKIEGAEEQIKEMAEKRAVELYGNPLPKIIRDRLDKELNSIINNGFAVLYLIAQKLVKKSNDDGYLVGSRGSVGSSFVAYLIGITEVNSVQPHYRCDNGECKYSEFITDGSYECGFDLPKKTCPKCGKQLTCDGYDIPFETFLGFEGDKEPDIDLNFSGEYQSRAHKYAEELFGEGHVYRAGTIGSVAEKTAIAYVRKYFEEKSAPINNAEIMRLSMGCAGVKKTSSQHPGGIMIIPSDKEVYDFTPIQHPADDKDSDIITTHFDYHFLHGSILKLDVLAHVDPTAIKMLESLTGIDAKTIEIGEQKTMSLFHSTEALGVSPKEIDSDVGTIAIPEFGTSFVRQMLVDTKPTLFSELIRISGLSHGTDVWLGNAQMLIEKNICTLKQAICCRDDIMLYLQYHGVPSKTAFFIMEDVRKGKGLKTDQEQIMRDNNVPEWYIDSCKLIKYMFPKAHAAAYVMMAFRIAWFKVYYPIEFYTTYFSTRSEGNFDEKFMTRGVEIARKALKEFKQIEKPGAKEKGVITLLEVVIEMYCRGITFAQMSVFDSDAINFKIVDGKILPPLVAVQGLGETVARKIKDAINDGNGNFTSQDEFKRRTGCSQSVIESLMACGALDNNLPETSQITLFE